MSDNWKEVRLNKLYTFRAGLSKGKKFFGYGYPFLSYREIFDNYFVPRQLNNLADATEEERDKFSIKRGDVFLTRTSETVEEIGISCVAIKNYPNATFNGFAKRLRPITDEILPEYAGFYFRSPYFRSKASSLCTLITRASLNNGDLSYLTIKYPEYDIQRKIAGILSAYNDLIENNTRCIAILEEMAQRIYKEWFVDFKYPGHENDKPVESELGKIPEGWEVKKLSELVETQYGYTESAQKESIGPKYVRGTDINKSSYINWSKVPYCPIDDGNLKKYRLSVGDVVIIRMADPGKVGIIEKDIEAVFASYLIRLTPTNSNLPSYYLFYFLLSDYYQNYITGASTGTTRKSASAGVITDIKIVVSKYDIFKMFEQRITELRKLINNLLDQNNNLRETRDLLLPKLISDQLEVKDIAVE